MYAVATREGGVDRNTRSIVGFRAPLVATREGGVDRNVKCEKVAEPFFGVATREGGVDRNPISSTMRRSPAVATREGGVDRNSDERCTRLIQTRSPPARVAWIETPL